MEDTISRKMAIDEIKALYEWHDTVTEDRTIDHLKRLPSAQPETHDERMETHACDLIDRQAAIEAVRELYIQSPKISNDIVYDMAIDQAHDALVNLPSAQPEKRTENTRKTHACDLIDRQAAIDAHYEYCNKHPDAGFPVWSLKILEDLPSAQQEPCVDTIDALDESIKHFDDMAEECRRNANIERNDYMDMRDDAAEYRQLSIWLNELKWLRERFQSQPDLSEYSDKLWKRAYERGRAEAQQRWIPCSERLPEEGQSILVTTTDNAWGDVVIIRTYYKEMHKSVIAWMPLPEPWRGEKHES